jgi:uncharacterized protein
MTCPICSKPVDAKYKPFCSRRCADVDLGKWLNGSYRVASTREDDPEELERAIIQAEPDDAAPKKPH